MQIHDLSGREPALPLTLELENGQQLLVEHWLRVLPGQRYVAQAQWQGRTVLAKLLVGSKAARQLTRETVGAQMLIDQQINSAALLGSELQTDGSAYVLFEFIEQAQSLNQAWQACAAEPPLSERQTEVLGSALGMIAQMHLRGLWQSDLHLDNLLHKDQQLYVVDGGGVQSEHAGQPLSEEQVIDNLAVFFAQLPSALDEHLEMLLMYYLMANGEHALRLEKLQKRITGIRQWRVKDYLNKAGRDCSLFSAKRNAWGLRVVWRAAQHQLKTLLADPDAAIDAGHIYKTGGAATVARVAQGQQQWVVKRYNIKNFAHWCKRFWRPSRAWHSWLAGHRLMVLGIATPQPLAVIENRWCGLRGSAWLISEYCGEQDIIDRFASYQSDGIVPESEIDALVALLNALIREKISHGDLKGHNILWHQGRCVLIDLDAMQHHQNMRSFSRAFLKDRTRLLRNWPHGSPLYTLLDQRLPQLPSSCPED
ncbi:MAG: serine/threonine protein kinase [Gammaproteobacteria bacterium]|nr:serine/threonine protein kinase [Gammaproteobacteria bacterium]